MVCLDVLGNVAGVEGVLRAYAAMKAAKPKLAIRQFDELVKRQAAGQLGTAIDAGLAKCNDQSSRV